MPMKITLSVLIAGLIVFGGISPLDAEDIKPVVRIGIVTDGPWARHTETVDLFKKEILVLTMDEFDVQFPAEFSLNGQWTQTSIKNAIDTLLSDSGADIIITLGYISTHEIAKRRNVPKPVISPFVIDANVQNLPLKEGASGVDNLSYINFNKTVDRNIQAFREVTLFNNLTVLADSLIVESIPELHEHAVNTAKKKGIKLNIVTLETSIEEAVENLPPFTDAVLVSPLLRVTDEDFQTLVEELIKKKLPSFSFWGRDEVERGILASITPANTLHYIARNVAANVHDILRGENAGTLPTGFIFSEQFTINMATARAIDIYPSLSILTEADLLNEERKDITRVLTLESAVQEALAANLDLAAADRIVLAGEQSVLEARSTLLPQIGIGSSAELIDEDRAESSMGRNPERAWRAFADAQMPLYSDKVWSNYTVQKHFQDSLIEEREALKLDIIQTTATAYLNILRAKTIERIQKENLKLTRANLERARVRQTIGAAGPDEVYRWESEIAKDRQTVLESETTSMNTMNDLNRILNRSLEEPFVAQEAELNDPLLSISNKLFSTLVNQPKGFGSFSAFMVQEGLEASPELRRFDAEIAAKDREIVSAKRSFWLPDFSLQALISDRFAESGAGSDTPAGVDSANTTDWTVGVFATLPLFTSGQKRAALKRTQEELDALSIEREATSERIEERIRNAINITRSSYPSIQLSREAAEAAQKNLELITDSYTEGIKSIIDLLDAQNTALVADQRAANANYNFLIDLMNVQRAVGRFDFFLSEEDRQEWLHRYEIFSKESGVELREH